MKMFFQHRKKLLKSFPKKEKAIIFIQGGKVITKDDTDYEYAFRQESNFYYLTGITEPDVAAIIEIPSGKYHLVFPRRSKREVVFAGLNEVPVSDAKRYGADSGFMADELQSFLRTHQVKKFYVTNKKDEKLFQKRKFLVDADTLLPKVHALRKIKDNNEVAYIKIAAAISGEAHVAVMRATKPGMHEYELKAVFDSEVGKRGSMRQAYEGIFAAGKNAAVLHYIKNNSRIKNGNLVLVDAAAEWQGYASDITRTFPANGRFTKEQAELYDAVLDTQNEVVKQAKPGATIQELHLLAKRKIVEHMLSLGFLRGGLDELIENNIGNIFFPHGIGHLLGIDTHDVGGKTPASAASLRNLRFGDVLEPGMVFTVEPGIYFIKPLLDAAFSDPNIALYLNKSKITSSMNFGGIRIEDDVVVTTNGINNLTINVPRERKEIEKLMNK